MIGGRPPLVTILFKIAPSALFGIFIFGLLDNLIRRSKGEPGQHPIGWIGLLAILLILDPLSKLSNLLVGMLIAGPLWYLLYRYSKRAQPFAHPETLLLEFCTAGSIAFAGALSGLVVALYLYSLGLLQGTRFWQEVGIWKLLVVPVIGGAILGIVRRSLRRRWPRPVWVPYVYRRRLDGSGTWGEGMGLWMDEILLSVAVTPFLALTLMMVDPGWLALFMFTLALPSFFFYIFWEFLNGFWLRLIGVVNRRREMLFMAYEALLKRSALARWLGEIAIEWRDDHYIVKGLLPAIPVRTGVKQCLENTGKSADVTEVDIDPNLEPNPWFQLALIRQQRGNRRAS